MTTRISIIAAVTRDGGLGHKGNLLYRIDRKSTRLNSSH